MTVTVDPRIGSELAGYRVEALLGRGGMSDVYLAQDLRLKRRVALKLLAPDLARDERFRERFLRESELAASLDHANVIPVFEAGEADGVLYIAMRYVEGSDLKSVLAADGRLGPEHGLALLDQVAAALDAAHERGLVHRDVKPGNILVATQGGREHVYLSDFGLTKHTAEEKGLTDSGQFFGTADYVAPEQIEGGQIDGRADVYSLGCVLYECLAGEPPFGSDSKVGLLFAHLQNPPPSLTQQRPELPAGIDAVIATAMAKEPDQRYASCGELAEAAHGVLVGAAPAALPAALAGPAPPLVGREEELEWLRRAWSAAQAGSGALLVLSGPRGIGKTRLATELAGEASADRGAVRYATCVGSDGATATLAGAVQASGPTLLILEDLDAADAALLEALESIAGALADQPLLMVGTYRRATAMPELERLVALLSADRVRELGPLTADGARQIAALHAGADADAFPVETALEATEGVPLRLHEVASEWARAEASRRLGSAAEHAAAERSSLREAEAAVAENVVGLRLIEERARLYSPAPLAGPETRDVCPFKGLASFEAADADYFFGRERLVAELVARLVGAGFLGIVGPSGSGKSSLLRAGLLPGLATGVLPGSERWRRVLIRPGEHPLEELGRALGLDHGNPLAAAIGTLAPGERLIVAVDQFEELFTACSSEQERTDFAETLVAAAGDPEQRAVVVVAARADFYGRCAAYPALAELLGANHVLVGPMQAEELRRAIELPAARAGLQVEPELVEALVADVKHEAGGLPLLSTSLLELWQKRTDNRLELATYQDSGGVHGAVARLAEDAYGRLSDTERLVARNILLRLAGEGEGDTVVRRRAPLAELDVERDEDRAHVLAVLTERRLVTVSEGTVEVAHEALLREWPRLREWIQEDSQGRSLRRHITESANEWDAAGRDQDSLYRGARLAAALDWTADHEHDLNQLERDFVTESREASEQETKRVRRTNRRLRGLLIGVAVLLAAAIAGGTFAVVQRGQARDAATAQLAQRLGAQALADDNLARSLLLARQAVAVDDSPQTRSDLLADLLRAPAAAGVTDGIDGNLVRVAISPDGRLLAVSASSPFDRLFLFDARSLKQLGKPHPTPGTVLGLAFSPDGQTLALLSAIGGAAYLQLQYAGTVAQQAELVPPVTWPLTATGRVAYSPEGSLLATADLSETGWRIVLRDPTTGEEVGSPIDTGSSGQVDFAFTPDGRSVVSSNENGGAALVQWDLETRRVTRSFEGRGGGALAIGPDGRLVAIGRADGSVGFVDLETGREYAGMGRHNAAVTSATFSSDGTRLATTSEDETVIFWDVESGVPRERLRGHSASVQSGVFSPDGDMLYTVGLDRTAIAWDMTGDRWLGRAFAFAPHYGTPSGHLYPGRFGPDGTLIAIGSPPQGIELRDARGLEPVGERLPAGDVSMFDFSRDGRILASIDWAGVATIWDVKSRKVLRSFSAWTPRPDGWSFFPSLSISPDGTTLAVTGENGVTLWDIATGASMGTVGDDTLVTGVTFDSTGQLVAFGRPLAFDYQERSVGHDQGTAEVWDIGEHRRIVTMRADDIGLLTVAFSPVDKLLATGGLGSVVRLWDPGTGELVRELDARGSGQVVSTVFSPDGTILAVSGSEGNVSLWDVATGVRIGSPLQISLRSKPDEPLWTAVGFSPDGKRILMTTADGRAIVWDVDPESWKRRACEIANRTLTQEEWHEFLPGRPYEPACTAG